MCRTRCARSPPASSRTQQRGLKGSALALAPARALAARQMRAKTEAQAPKQHYPAPHALIDLWDEHGGDRDAMQRGEIESFARCWAATPRRTWCASSSCARG